MRSAKLDDLIESAIIIQKCHKRPKTKSLEARWQRHRVHSPHPKNRLPRFFFETNQRYFCSEISIFETYPPSQIVNLSGLEGEGRESPRNSVKNYKKG